MSKRDDEDGGGNEKKVALMVVFAILIVGIMIGKYSTPRVTCMAPMDSSGSFLKTSPQFNVNQPRRIKA